MLEESALTLVDPFQCWEDTYEGAFYRAINNEDTFNYLVSITHHRDDNPKEIQNLKSLLRAASVVKSMSWTGSCDCLQMWAAYSYDRKAIMVKTQQSAFPKLFADNMKDIYDGLTIPFMCAIKYDFIRDDDIWDFIISEFDSIRKPSINPYAPYLHKRADLSFENEVRVCAEDIKGNGRKTGKLKITSIQDFIDYVIVHPSASKQFTGKVRNLCAKYGLQFHGKSQKYDFILEKN